MRTIEIDEQTAKELQNAAQAQGVTIAEIVRRQVLGKAAALTAYRLPGDLDFDAELDALVFSGPTLSADFSRADIYSDE